MGQDRLAGPRLPRQDVQPAGQLDPGLFDQEQVLYAKLEQHSLWSSADVGDGSALDLP